jgi:hypothetical protein
MVESILGGLGGLGEMGADVILKVLAGAIDAVGEGTEWTGDQVARLGELQQQLADKVQALAGE